eukprot:scaffold121991_cov30-Tisochrysis_lutea.AAC.5
MSVGAGLISRERHAASEPRCVRAIGRALASPASSLNVGPPDVPGTGAVLLARPISSTSPVTRSSNASAV